MKNIYNLLQITFCILILTNTVMIAQTTAEYEIFYNQIDCVYEARVHFGGDPRSFPNTRSFPTQFTVVVPASISDVPFNVISNVHPSGADWQNDGNTYAPMVNPSEDFHTFSWSGGGGSSTYPSPISPGDVLTLFTFTVPMNECGSGIRLFINGTDPNSTELIPDTGADHSQSFGVLDIAFGGNVDLYIDNISNDPVLTEDPITNPTAICDGTTINLTANPTVDVCATGTTTYAWEGPNSFVSTDQNPAITVTDPAIQEGVYTVTVTDSKGCSAIEMVNLAPNSCNNCPAGCDQFPWDGR